MQMTTGGLGITIDLKRLRKGIENGRGLNGQVVLDPPLRERVRRRWSILIRMRTNTLPPAKWYHRPTFRREETDKGAWTHSWTERSS